MTLQGVPLLLLLAQAAAAPPTGSDQRWARVVTAERLPIPAGHKIAEVRVDALAATVELRGLRKPAAVAAVLGAKPSRICPEVKTLPTSVLLTCKTRRLEAGLATDRKKPYLDILELRGLPWRGEGQDLRFFYDPVRLAYGGPCPGTTPVTRGECLLRDGKTADAAVQFRKALEIGDRTLPALRLGDIAQDTGDGPTAAGWYRQAAELEGHFARVARIRLCGMGATGTCLSQPNAPLFDGTDIPEPLRSEVILAGARVAAYMGQPAEALKRLPQVLPPRANGGACREAGRIFCRRLVLMALRQAGRAGGMEALEAYLTLPERLAGPLATELAQAAAEKAAEVGAPVFAGNLLAATRPKAGGAGAMSDHLLRAAELYVQGGDLARARIVLEYAESRAGRGKALGPRWAALRGEIRQAGEEAEGPEIDTAALIARFEALAAETARDLKAARESMGRARRVSP